MSSYQELSLDSKIKFLSNIQQMRGIAIIFIVAVHCITTFPWQNNFERDIWFTFFMYGTGLFIFISGYLFQHIFRDRFNYKKFLISKLKFVILPYLIFSIPSIIQKLYFESFPFYFPKYWDINVFTKILYMILTGKHFGPFWFIPVMIIIYLLSQALRLLQLSKMSGKLIFSLILFIGIFSFDFGHKFNPFISLIFALPIYVFGIALRQWEDLYGNFSNRIIIFFCAIYILITVLELNKIIIIDFSYGYENINRHGLKMINFTKIKVCVLCIIFLHLLKFTSPPIELILNKIAKFSFGVFFVHLFLIRSIETITRVYKPSFNLNSLSYFMLFTMAISSSFLIIKLIKTIFGGRSRYVIGS